jgi:hypothetical protein
MAAGEMILRHGPNTAAPRVLFVPPLFEEANRMRRTLVLAMRALAELGIASLLPDLPGQNESLVATDAVDMAIWRTALADIVAAEPGPVMIASVRGGALIDNGADAEGWWRLAPVTGAPLLRTMLRTRVASDREVGIISSIDGLIGEAGHRSLMLAGNLLSPAMIGQLQDAVPTPTDPLRTVALGEGPDEVVGSPLWLRAEPGEDAAMARAMAADICEWMATCGLR